MEMIYRERASALVVLNEPVRVLYFLTVFYFAILFSSVQYQAAILVTLLILSILSGVLKEVLRFAAYMATFALILSIISVLFGPGGPVLFRIPFISITYSPVLFSISMGLRLVNSVIALNLLLLAVNPDSLLAMLSRAGRRSASALMVATRFLPVISNEGKEVIEAFESRCVSIRSGSIRRRAAAASQLIYPVLFSSMDRTLSIAAAMELRGMPDRWIRSRSEYAVIDWCQIVVLAAALIYGTAIALTGSGMADYYGAIYSIRYGLNARMEILFLLLTPVTVLAARLSHDINQKFGLPVRNQ